MSTRILWVTLWGVLFSASAFVVADEPWLPKNSPERPTGGTAVAAQAGQPVNEADVAGRHSYRGFEAAEEPGDALLWHGIDIYHGSK